MRRVLVTGGGGFIGRFACEQLAARGIAVRVLDIYPPSRPAGWDEEYLIGDVRDPARVAEAVAGVDGVLHLAAAHHDQGIEHDTFYAVNEAGTATLTAAMEAAGVRSLCFYSSAAVYGSEGRNRDEAFPKTPDNPYGGSKLAGEKVIEAWVARTGARALIIRPTVVFGRENFANVYKLIGQIARRRYLQVGAGTNIKSLAAVTNLVAATAWLWLDRPDASGVYNFADGPDLSSAEIAQVIYEALGRSRPSFSVPLPLALALASPYDVATKLTGRDLGISTARIRKLADATTQLVPARLVREGWTSPTPLRTALADMVKWYVEVGARLPPQRRIPPAVPVRATT
jgi:nucleoside-diphosphate-sugar epimerase